MEHYAWPISGASAIAAEVGGASRGGVGDVDASICAEIESVDGLLNKLLGGPTLDVPLADETLSERVLHAECEELKASLVGARGEVERLVGRQSALEKSLGSSRDEVGRLRAERSVFEAEQECWLRQRESFQQRAAEAAELGAKEAAELRRKLQECQQELVLCGSVHAWELGELQQEVRALQRELQERWAAMESGFSSSPQDTPMRSSTWLVQAALAATRGGAAPTDVEGAVLELCRRLELDAMAVPEPNAGVARVLSSPQSFH